MSKRFLLIGLLGASFALTGCLDGAPSAEQIKTVILEDGQQAAVAQKNLFRKTKLTKEQEQQVPNLYEDVKVSDCRKSGGQNGNYVCFVSMKVDIPLLGKQLMETDMEFRKTAEGAWRFLK